VERGGDKSVRTRELARGPVETGFDSDHLSLIVVSEMGDSVGKKVGGRSEPGQIVAHDRFLRARRLLKNWSGRSLGKRGEGEG